MDGWPCWAISNHDVQRAVTRWGGPNASPDFARQMVGLVCSLRGSVCLYQGEELGLPEADVPFEQLRDPYGITFWPNFKGRDGCRTPMPWTGADDAGFSTGTPWLPIPDAHRQRSVATQEADPHSVLATTRHFLHWRRDQPALVAGAQQFIAAPEPVLAFVRGDAGSRLLVVFNLSASPVAWPLPAHLGGAQATGGHGLVAGSIEAGMVHLPAHAALFATLD